MAAASYSSDVLQTSYRPTPRRENNNLGKFWLFTTKFDYWLHAWRMDISETNPSNRDLIRFETEKFTNIVEQEMKKLKNVKVSFALEINFSIERNGETEYKRKYFEDKPHIFNRYDEEEIKEKFDEFIQGKIENWSEKGSGWVVERITLAYVNVTRYQPLKGGTYLPLPAKLANKKAIINVQNKDNECLKWALRSALFPPKDGKNPQRPSKYPKNDGINYRGIDFPTPVGQIDKLEAKNRNLAINVFGWENDEVTIHRVSKTEANVPRINLMLIESGIIQHYCYIKKSKKVRKQNIFA